MILMNGCVFASRAAQSPGGSQGESFSWVPSAHPWYSGAYFDNNLLCKFCSRKNSGPPKFWASQNSVPQGGYPCYASPLLYCHCLQVMDLSINRVRSGLCKVRGKISLITIILDICTCMYCPRGPKTGQHKLAMYVKVRR